MQHSTHVEYVVVYRIIRTAIYIYVQILYLVIYYNRSMCSKTYFHVSACIPTGEDKNCPLFLSYVITFTSIPQIKMHGQLSSNQFFRSPNLINLFLDCQPKFIYLHPSSVIITNLLHDNNLGYDDCYRHLSFSSPQSSHARRTPPPFLIIIIP